MTDSTEPVAAEDLYAQAITLIREGDLAAARPIVDRLTAAAGTTTEEEWPRFEKAAVDPDEEVDLLDDLQMMGALMQVAPAPQPRVFNFEIPERALEADPLAHLLPGNPANLRGLTG